MSPSQKYELLCIGNYTKDTIISPTGVEYVDGGAINYAAHAAARLGFKVAVVTHLAEEDKRVVDKLLSAGIDCYATYTPTSTCMKLEYPTYNPDIRTLSVTSTASSISPDEVINIQTKAAIVGTSFRGEVGLEVIRALNQNKVFLGADMQGFVRVLRGQSLVYEPWGDMQQTLPYLDVLKSDAVEAECLTGEADIYKAVEIFAQMGPREIILTHKDGLLVYADGNFYQAGFYSRVLNGRSGRGDTCIGTYMAMRINLNPYQSSIWAAAVTSLKMEKLGTFDRTRDEVVSLIRDKYISGLTAPDADATQ